MIRASTLGLSLFLGLTAMAQERAMNIVEGPKEKLLEERSVSGQAVAGVSVGRLDDAIELDNIESTLPGDNCHEKFNLEINSADGVYRGEATYQLPGDSSSSGIFRLPFATEEPQIFNQAPATLAFFLSPETGSDECELEGRLYPIRISLPSEEDLLYFSVLSDEGAPEVIVRYGASQSVHNLACNYLPTDVQKFYYTHICAINTSTMPCDIEVKVNEAKYSLQWCQN